jgi:hypothetical protein
MATYFRIKEITAPATVLRQHNLLSLELGDFIYPEELDTLVCANTVVYWDEHTGESFVCEPQNAPVINVNTNIASVPNNVVVPEQVPAEVVPAPLETGSEDTKA